jgi:peptidoglycan hydrolase-like amidase
MSKRSHLPKIFGQLRAFAIPLISVASFIPLLAFYGLPSDTSPKNPTKPVLSSQPEDQTRSPLLKKYSNVSSAVVPQTQNPAPPQTQTQAKKQIKPSASPKTASKPAQKTKPLPAPPAYKAPKMEIKVAVVKDEASTVIGTSTKATLQDGNGRSLKTISASQGYAVQPNGSSLKVGDWELPYAVWVQPSGDGLVHVGDRWYRGRLLLVSQGSSLIAVNYVNLEEYLYSVVGSEMHANAPTEALKAQAIAARSYALVHIIRPASDWYNLGATQRWQVYKGLTSEHDATYQAVNATAGQILSYKGGIVESLYAATDEIVSNVHQGIGMSQTGAYDLASQGYDYQEILGRYYPGVSLARLETK